MAEDFISALGFIWRKGNDYKIQGQYLMGWSQNLASSFQSWLQHQVLLVNKYIFCLQDIHITYERWWRLYSWSHYWIGQNILVEFMFPAYVYIPCVLGIEDQVTVVALVSSRKVNVFNVARQGVSPCRCLVTDLTLVCHHTSILLNALDILYQTLLVTGIISCKKILIYVI